MKNMSKKADVLLTACIIVAILVIVFLGFSISKIPAQQASTDTTKIDGVLYSTKPTPYGIFIIRFFELLPNGGMSAESEVCWLLYYNEPTPPNIRAEPSGTIQMAGPPLPDGDVMTNGWLYSQTPTNFIKFTLPPSTTKYWTETIFEPIPPNAQIQH